MIDETIYWNALYDYYGSLLTENQREIFESYYAHNMTLQEIADNNNVSKNAIHKTVNAIIEKLETYEENIQYYAKVQKIRGLIKDEKVLHDIMEIL